MTTSDVAHRAILFTKRNCAPCQATKEFAHAIKTELTEYLSIMDKDNHSALVVAYDLSLYPTLLVVDEYGHELKKIIGGKSVREHLVPTLQTIKRNRNT